MISGWFIRQIQDISSKDGNSAHLAVGAMLVVTILYASTMVG